MRVPVPAVGNHFPEQSAVAGGDVFASRSGRLPAFTTGQSLLRSTIQGQMLALPCGGSAAGTQPARSTRLLLTVGRLNARRRHRDLIPAIPAILKEFPETCFVLGRRWGFASGARKPSCRNIRSRDQVLLLGVIGRMCPGCCRRRICLCSRLTSRGDSRLRSQKP